MQKRGLFLVFMAALVSGVSIFINKFGVSGINPFLFTGLKNIVVAFFLFSLLLGVGEFRELKHLSKKQWSKLVWIGFIGGSIPFLLFFKGLQLTTALNGAFIHKTLFVIVAVLSSIFLKEKINKKYMLGALLLLGGNALLLKFMWIGFGMGDLLVLIATFLWAGEIILSKHTLRDLTGNQVAFGRMFFGSLFIMIFLAASGNLVAITVNQLTWIVVTSIFLLLYVFTFYNGLKYVQAHVAASILLLGQIVTFGLSYVLLDTVITPVQAVGMLAMLAGAITVIGIPKLKFSIVEDGRY
jgi:drug/metabolite transporter (DMT)-like permease